MEKMFLWCYTNAVVQQAAAPVFQNIMNKVTEEFKNIMHDLLGEVS